jgi:hypothetical protein
MSAHQFDVFLSHNSRDKAQVRELAALLRKRRLRVWLDEDELVPGEKWQQGLERGLLTSKSVAVCLGQHEMGRWQDPEMQVALNLAVKSELRVLPILLPGAERSSEVSAFLELYTWVDLRTGFAADGIDRLVWGVTGEKKAAVPQSLPAIEGQNPFGQVGAIRDASRFVGRKGELRRLLHMLEHGSAVIVGPWQIGKSSLMLRVAERWPEEILGPIDFQSFISESDFVGQLAKKLNAPAADWPSLRDTLGERRVLILLENFDSAPRAGIDLEFFIRLRALLGANPGISILGTSVTPLKDLYTDEKTDGSAPFSLLQHFSLGPLSRPEAELLLDHPWAPAIPLFEPEAKERLIAEAGQHPRRLQRAAYHFFESLLDSEYDWLANWRLENL